MDCLYVSHTGMTEPLGRSQVLPYVIGLARRGFSIGLLSHEPAGTSAADVERARGIMAGSGIRWLPQVRSASHSLGVKVWESGRAALLGLATALRHRPRIIHARSYLPAAVADVVATVAPGAKMLFDCRGMLGDEYVDAGHWTAERFEYRLVKRFEQRAFRRAEGIVVLTEALHDWLRSERHVPAATPITVVPCCVESERFAIDAEERAALRADLGLTDRTVLVYSGTLGSWYQEREMARFAATLQVEQPDLAWLVLTRSDPARLLAAARESGVRDVRVRSASPAEMPRLLSAGDVGLSFIRPCFSKMGSSPTKVAEYLASGMIAVVNSGIGDQGALAEETEACVVARSYDERELRSVAARASALLERPPGERWSAARRVARDRFSLVDLGIPRYEALYHRLMS